MNTRILLALATSGALALAACSGATGSDPTDENNENNATNNATNNNTGGTNNTTNNDDSRGAADFTGLVINELVADGDPNDWVEFYNNSDAALDLTNVSYSDDPEDITRAVFPAGTQIGAGGYVSVELTDFGLSKDGEDFTVYAPNGEAIDTVTYGVGDAVDGRSYGRFPNGTGDFASLGEVTRDRENEEGVVDPNPCGDGVIDDSEVCDGDDVANTTCADLDPTKTGPVTCSVDCREFVLDACVDAPVGQTVFINELDADGDPQDWFELYNSSDAAVALDGWYIVDAKFDPADPTSADSVGARFDFPAGASIPAGDVITYDRNQDDPTAGFPFGLSKDDDSLTLYNAADEVVDTVTWTTEISPDAASYARTEDGGDTFETSPTNTKGDLNSTD